MEEMDTFEYKLEKLLNCHSKECESDTPDFILANYLTECLKSFNNATKARTKWYKKPELIGHSDFFAHVHEGTFVLSNDRDADVFCSWKAGGQDFYAYAKYNVPPNNMAEIIKDAIETIENDPSLHIKCNKENCTCQEK